MSIRPYHVYLILVPLLVVPGWRLLDRPQGEFSVSAAKVHRWVELTGQPPEGLDGGVTRRYQALAGDLEHARDVGYFSEKDKSGLWAESASPEGHNRIERYYMAQSTLAPALLRFDELHALIVIDCATVEQARGVLRRENLVVIQDYGRGLMLARPES